MPFDPLRIMAGLLLLYCVGSVFWAYKSNKIAYGRGLKGLLYADKNKSPKLFNFIIVFHVCVAIQALALLIKGHF